MDRIINSKRLTPAPVFFISLFGLLPIIALVLIAGEKSGDILLEPEKYYQMVKAAGFGGKFLIIIGNIGDAMGYYLIILPLAYVFARSNGSALARNGGRLLFAYGINGAFWAAVSAVALPLALSSGYQAWQLTTWLCQSVGWGVVGNTLGSLGWIVLGAGLWKGRRGFSVFSMSLGIMYFLGGRISGTVMPAYLVLLGTAYYLLLQLLIWNPWAAKTVQKILADKEGRRQQAGD